METPFAPRPVSEKSEALDLTGFLVLWNEEFDDPFYVSVHGTKDTFLVLFSNHQKMEDYCSVACPDAAYGGKHVINPSEMIASLPYWCSEGVRLRIMIDPWINERGNTRFKEVLREEPTHERLS